ncbi:MAG: signal peptidase I [Lachnospiraceae bacterium]|nr:signal peptidase I [Lachnospiraceae bacterium]
MKDFLNALLNAVLWALMAFLLLMVISGIVQRFAGSHANGLFGIGYAVVVSGSMEPNIHVDDMIIYNDHAPEEYKVGDVIVYKRNAGTPEEMLITHRIVEISEDGERLVTRGDANRISDPEISFTDVVGRLVWRIPKFGIIAEFIKKPVGIAAAVLLLGLIFAGNILLTKKSVGSREIRTVNGTGKLSY